MKRIFAFLFVISMLSFSVISVSAETIAERTLPLVVDASDLLTDVEEEHLCNRLETISATYKTEVAILIVPDLEGLTPQEFADDFYDYCGYGYGENDDGLLVLYKDGEEGERELYITTHGTAIDVFDDEVIDTLLYGMKDYLVYDEFMEAFNYYTDECEYYLEDYYTVGVDLIWIPICLIGGFILAMIITLIQKAGLKSVRRRYNATEYVRRGSMKITNANDIFLYRNITRTEIPKESSSTHKSSSGRTHGGGGISF